MVLARILLPLLPGLLLLASCQQQFKIKKGRPYHVSGQVANCEGCEVKLQLYDYNRYKTEQTAIQVDTVKNGRFAIAGRTTRPGFYEIHIKQPQSRDWAGAVIYLPADSVHLRADLNGLPPGKLQRFYTQFQSLPNFNARTWAGSFVLVTASSSSPVQQDITQYFLLRDSLMLECLKKEGQTLEAFRATFGSGNRKLTNAWADSVRQAPTRYAFYKAQAADLFIRRHRHAEAAILAMLDNHHEKTTNYRFNQYFKALPPRLQTSFYGQVLAKSLTVPDKPAKYKQNWVGSSITYLKGQTPAGRPLDVAAVFRQNKLTLVNFWASWHGPSRWQMPAYQKLYRQYHGKGFDLIAVSFDMTHGAWTRAIAEEGLAFRHVSELKGPKAEDYLRFRIRDMPFNILFDARGKMVAVDLTPQEVARQLEQGL
jgi:thiol-disulfide isomerase/thioredoxin